MKSKAIIPLVLGLGMGLVAIKLTMDTLDKAKADSRNQADRQVVRARQDIESAITLTPEMLEVVNTLDAASAVDADFADLESLEERVSRKFIPAGAVITSSMLAEEGTPPGVAGRIRPGFRAVGVKIDEVSSVAFNVKPGDWVDVIVVMDYQHSTSRKKETIAEVVLQHVEVAAIGLSTSQGNEEASVSRSKAARSATLLVKESDVPKLHLAAIKGKITLAMRGDEDLPLTDEIFRARDSQLFGALFGSNEPETEQAAPVDPVEPPPPPEPVEQTRPFVMVVMKGSTIPGVAPITQTITYESADSNRILSVQSGLMPVQRNARRADGPEDESSSQDSQANESDAGQTK